MVEIGQGQIITAIISIVVLIGIFAGLLYVMYTTLMIEIRKKTIDKSLNEECKKKVAERDKKIEKLKDQYKILMAENLYIADQRNDLAIKLKQEIDKI